jgi:hypothetical protein
VQIVKSGCGSGAVSDGWQSSHLFVAAAAVVGQHLRVTHGAYVRVGGVQHKVVTGDVQRVVGGALDIQRELHVHDVLLLTPEVKKNKKTAQ